jgi:hypothetical protein
MQIKANRPLLKRPPPLGGGSAWGMMGDISGHLGDGDDEGQNHEG